MSAVPKYKIKYDRVKNDYVIQRYINSVLGWTFVTTKPSLKEAMDWIIEGTIVVEIEND